LQELNHLESSTVCEVHILIEWLPWVARVSIHNWDFPHIVLALWEVISKLCHCRTGCSYILIDDIGLFSFTREWVSEAITHEIVSGSEVIWLPFAHLLISTSTSVESDIDSELWVDTGPWIGNKKTQLDSIEVIIEKKVISYQHADSNGDDWNQKRTEVGCSNRVTFSSDVIKLIYSEIEVCLCNWTRTRGCIENGPQSVRFRHTSEDETLIGWITVWVVLTVSLVISVWRVTLLIVPVIESWSCLTAAPRTHHSLENLETIVIAMSYPSTLSYKGHHSWIVLRQEIIWKNSVQRFREDLTKICIPTLN